MSIIGSLSLATLDRGKLYEKYETIVSFSMDRITYAWNIFKKEKYC